MRNLHSSRTFPAFMGFLALAGCFITLAQIGITLKQGAPLCLNQGCEIVEALTLIPPLFFNIAGLFFFSTLYISIQLASRRSSIFHHIVTILLLAGIAVEAVLINFQHFIAQTFCAYCLIICGLVVLLNITAGGKQTLRAVAIFAAVTAAFASLNFQSNGSSKIGFYKDGVFATRQGTEPGPDMYLFFSSTCNHCEIIIDQLKGDKQLTINFNPIDTIEELDISPLEYHPDYSQISNRKTLAALGINEIPVLLINNKDSLQIFKGEKAISSKLFTTNKEIEKDLSSDGFSSDMSYSEDIPTSQDDGCSVDTDCEEGAELIPPGTAPE